MPPSPAPAVDPRGSRAGAVVRRLAQKYAELLALRDAHARGEDPPDVKARLRALAARFPGALRELDQLPRQAIVARLAALEAAPTEGPLATWMIATDRVHRWLRVALRRPTALARERGRLVPVVRARVAAELGVTPVDVEVWLGLARAHVRPPG